MGRLSCSALGIALAGVLLLAPLPSDARPSLPGQRAAVVSTMKRYERNPLPSDARPSLPGQRAAAVSTMKRYERNPSLTASARAPAAPPKSLAAQELAYTRRTFEELAGSRPLNVREVREALAAAPIRGERGVYELTEETKDRGPVFHRFVRTGTTAAGRPKGYVRSSWFDVTSGEDVVHVNGVDSSWVRRASGGNSVVLVMRNRNLRGKDGKLIMPAGTRITFTGEDLGAAQRTTMQRKTLAGESLQRTTTVGAAGQVERYGLSLDRYGRMIEQRVRSAPDGSQRVLEQIYDGEIVRTTEMDSRGHIKERVLDRAAAERLLAKVPKGQDKGGESLRAYKGRGWLWRQQGYDYAGLGTVRARGRGGELSTVVSGFVSPLGTRFGEVKQVHRRAGATRARGSQPVKTWSQRWGDPQPPDAPVPEYPALDEITAADRSKVGRSAAALTRAIGKKRGPFKIIIDPRANDGIATSRPFDDYFEARIGTRLAKYGSEANLIATVAHEMGHEINGKELSSLRRTDALDGQATSLLKTGALTGSTVAALHSANIERDLERYADRVSGTLTARVRVNSKNPSMTPADSLADLSSERQPWTPAATYDSFEERVRVTWQGYRQELQRLASAARRKPSPAARPASAEKRPQEK